ncbi:MAG: hypothetical protein PVJ21_20215 [Anaerolineales bacterium]|jgi:hypothetical protein
MKENDNNNTHTKGNLSLIYASSITIVILIIITSIAGLRSRTAIYPTEELVQSFLPNDVVNLFIGLPVLLGSMVTYPLICYLVAYMPRHRVPIDWILSLLSGSAI